MNLDVIRTMLATVFVFLGVEGASVYSRHAKRREDVGGATVLGFLSVFAVFASVTIVSYGIMWTGHFVFERNLPTVFKHPTTPFVIAWAVIRELGSRAARLVLRR